jgi:hypothetical protein
LRKANANACKNSNQATVTGSRGRDEGARGRLGWEKAPGRKGDSRCEAAREEEEEEEGKFKLLALLASCKTRFTDGTTLQAQRHASLPPRPNSMPDASRLTPHTAARFVSSTSHASIMLPQITPKTLPVAEPPPSARQSAAVAAAAPAPRQYSKLHLPALSESADCSFGS